MRKYLKPVPLGLRHRRDWTRWGRYCVCGLRWRTCPDRRFPVPVEEPPPTADRGRPAERIRRWASPVAVHRAGAALTGRLYRAGGGGR
jgi:hypothetical protein